MPKKNTAKDTLVVSEKRFKKIINKSIDGFAIADRSGKIIEVNNSYCQILGYSRDEILTMSLIDVDAKMTKEDFKTKTKKIINTGGARFETENFRNDGSRIEVEVSVSYEPENHGNFLVFIRDISDRIKATRALKKSEEKFRRIFDNLQDGYLWIDSEGKIILANQFSADILGYEISELMHKNMARDIYFFPEEREVVKKIIIQTGRISNYELAFKRKDGQKIFVEANSHLVYGENNQKTMEGTFRDITARKQAEENAIQADKRFRNLFEAISDLIFTQDMEGRFLSANPAMQKLFGYTEEEFLGRKASEFMKPELRPYYETDYLNLIKKLGYYEGISSYFKKDGSKIYIDYRISVVTEPKGGTYISGMGKDVTEKIKSERKMKQMEARINQSQKMETIGTLAGGIAHDFNNILVPILGHTEMLLSDVPKDTPMHTSLDKIYSAGMRAAALVKQILTFSRQGTSEVQRITIQPIIKEALTLIRSTIPTSIMIKQNIQKAPIMIKADPTQIHQVVMNLATNAYQAMEETGGELKVTLEQVVISEIIDPDMKPGEFACLTIADKGPGIDNETMNKIFDPFFTTKELGKGTGMGLSVVHGIAKSNDGFILVNSTPGKGSVFQVYFPLVDSQPEPPVSYSEPVVKGGKEHILIVDDEETIVKMTQQMLERFGYAVDAHTSSVKALEMFQKNAGLYDMVISDLTMPLMTGDQLARELIKIRPDIPILLCTGFSEKITAEKARLSGIKDVIIKPFVLSEISKKVRKVLDESGIPDEI